MSITALFPKSFKNLVSPDELIELKYSMTLAATGNISGSQLWLVEGDEAAFREKFDGQFEEISDLPKSEDYTVHIYSDFNQNARTLPEIVELKTTGDETLASMKRTI